MNQFEYEDRVSQQWCPLITPNQPQSSTFWTHFNVEHHLKELHHTLFLANSMQNELEMLMKVKEAKGYEGNVEKVDGLSIKRSDFDDFYKIIEGNGIDLGAQESISVNAANGLMSKLRFLLEPFRVVADEGSPWEEKSVAVRLNDKINKSRRNRLWRKRKRRRVAEMLSKEGEQFAKLDREADEWRAKEIAKDLAQQKVEKMKEIAKRKAKEERKKLEAELELALIVEKLKELRSIRIQKMKKQGHFLPEEDDRFLERVRAAVEEEERQATAAANTDAAREVIAAAEESRKVNQGVSADLKQGSSDDVCKEIHEQKTQSGSGFGSVTGTSKGREKDGCEGQSYGAYDYVANLPPEFYHYYHGSNTDMGTLIEVRRTWDAYIRHGGSRIPGHWIQPPPPADEIWASYVKQNQ
ncbi:hypothetical protein RND81_01G192800 [Saponaria officinalis]|uniref:Uncharacterized protein n=1 Tax=Saponaria officinalis TaxID=3572 RepID=A0AAW1NB08_SAPOF